MGLRRDTFEAVGNGIAGHKLHGKHAPFKGCDSMDGVQYNKKNRISVSCCGRQQHSIGPCIHKPCIHKEGVDE